MYDKYFNRIKLFWAADAHKKFMNKKNKNMPSSNQRYLFFAKDLLSSFVNLVLLLIAFAIISAAIFYSVIWLAW